MRMAFKLRSGGKKSPADEVCGITSIELLPRRRPNTRANLGPIKRVKWHMTCNEFVQPIKGGVRTVSVTTHSLWADSTFDRKGEQLARDESCDVCIVGAGIA